MEIPMDYLDVFRWPKSHVWCWYGRNSKARDVLWATFPAKHIAGKCSICCQWKLDPKSKPYDLDAPSELVVRSGTRDVKVRPNWQ